MEELITVVSNQGFAIAMATYTIVSVNKTMRELSNAVIILTEQIKKGDDK